VAQVNWQAGQIVTRGKGGKIVTTPITPTVRAILEPLKGHRPEYVFTYVAQRRHNPRTGERLVKGQRYPITYSGAKSAWKVMRKRSGITGFRFHDVRHDVGTKLLRATGNLKLVQRALNHAGPQDHDPLRPRTGRRGRASARPAGEVPRQDGDPESRQQSRQQSRQKRP
jgi:integrase